MSQTLCFRSAGPRRRLRKGEQLQLAAVGQGQVQLPGVAFGPVMLGQYGQAQDPDVEIARARVVGADQRHVVKAEQGG